MRMRIWASSSWRLRSDQRKKQKGSATGTAQDRIATTETGRRPILLMIVEDPSGNVSGLEVTAGNRQRDAISGWIDRARRPDLHIERIGLAGRQVLPRSDEHTSELT